MGLSRRVGLRSRRRACACTVAVGPATTTLIRLGPLPKLAGPTAAVLPSGADVTAAPPGAELDPRPPGNPLLFSAAAGAEVHHAVTAGGVFRWSALHGVCCARFCRGRSGTERPPHSTTSNRRPAQLAAPDRGGPLAGGVISSDWHGVGLG